MNKPRTRRAFIANTLKASLSIPLLSTGLIACQDQSSDSTIEDTAKKLKILILGGTSFLGPHQVAYALGRGHEVSIFTRGKTAPTVHQALFDQVEKLTGDRNDNLTALEGRQWDVVIDNSGRRAAWTDATAALLKDNCDLYLYTSSTGVYYPYLGSDFKEENEVLLELPESMTEEEELEYGYGVMKAQSELAAIQHFGKDRTIIVRPTYMIGPADKSNRFIHWPIRLSKGGEVLLPGKAEDPVQYLDVRDVAEWMIRLLEERKTGTFNAVGPAEAQTMYEFVEEASQAFEVETRFVKIDDFDFLKENNIYYIVPWIMPEGKNIGSAKASNEKAKQNGLTFRPIKESVKDTYDWWYSDNISQEQRDKVEQDPKSILVREATIIESWKEQVG